MKPHEHLLHLFTPRHTNNHRAKIFHPVGLLCFVVFLIVFQLALSFVHITSPDVLGYASNINIGDLLAQTNSRRAGAGVGSLTLNDQLSNAAAGKAQDMFANQYWAHTSPQGKEPWAFITGAGYNYVFAGENLARDFGDSNGVVDAWMNSPSHKENLLNSRFQDVGFAIQNGKYGDSETTLVVQMFGARAGEQAIAQAAVAPTATPNTPEPTPVVTAEPTLEPTLTASPTAVPIARVQETPPPPVVLQAESEPVSPKFDILAITKNIALAITLVLLAALAIDAFLVFRRKTVRLSGHNVAHVLIFVTVLVALTVITRPALIL